MNRHVLLTAPFLLLAASAGLASGADSLIIEKVAISGDRITAHVFYRTDYRLPCELLIGLNTQDPASFSMSKDFVKVEGPEGRAEITMPLKEWAVPIRKKVYVNLSPVHRRAEWVPLAADEQDIDSLVKRGYDIEQDFTKGK